jgi:EmrB/QacA subfamily drug resistance transporter
MKEPSLGKWAAFLTVSVSTFMCTVDGSILNVALPKIMDDLAAPLPAVQWVVIAYLLAIVTLLLSFGRLADIRGLMTINALGLAIFSGGSLCCAWSPNVASLIGFRGLQGLGASMVMACGPAVLTRVFPSRELGQAMGLIGTVVGVGLTSGPGLAGLILSHYSWRAIFYINVPLGFLGIFLSWKFIPRKPGDTAAPNFDFVGAAFMALALAGFLLTGSMGSRWGWGDLKTLLGLSITVIFCPLFIWWEQGNAAPVVDLSLFRVRSFRLALSAAICLFVSYFIAFFLMPFYLTKVLVCPIGQVGMLLMVPPLVSMVVAPVSGWFSDRIGPRLLTTTGLTVVAGALLQASRFTEVTRISEIALCLGIMGLGAALFQPPNTSSIMRVVPLARLGVASGLVAMSRNLGMVIGVALAGALFSSGFGAKAVSGELADYKPEMLPLFLAGWKMALYWAGVVAALGAVLTFLRDKETERRSQNGKNKIRKD